MARPRAAAPARRPLFGWRDELFLAAIFALAFFALRGLYGIFPFLFALGLAACAAFLALVARRLLREPRVAVRGFVLRDAGRLTRSGRIFAACAGLLLAGWAHCAAVQGAKRLGLWTESRLALASGRSRPTAATLTASQSALGQLERAARWGWLAQPDLAPAFERLGGRFAAGEDFAAAERAFLGAVASGGETPVRLHDLGLARARRGDLAAAERLWRRALELDPGFAPARENLGGLLAMGGRFAEAAAEFRRAVDRAPTDAATRLLLARALAATGDSVAAEAELERPLRLAPGLPGAAELAVELGSLPP